MATRGVAPVPLASLRVAARDTSHVAAYMLEGLTLDDGWRVVSKLERDETATGSNFSVGYIAERNGTRAYLKALDYSFAFELTGNIALTLEAMTTAYNFEVAILDNCASSRMDRIVLALGHGEISVEGAIGVPNVSYLLFELADGDIRHALDSADSNFDDAWKFRTLHHVAVALRQMHQADLAHQDVKPSNVLTFGRTSSKLGDLGRASRRGGAAPHDESDCAGDPQYAPPELLYGQISNEWRIRRQACDIYLLGSLAMFLFAGTTTTAAILSFIGESQHPDEWGDSYEAALPYVRLAFDRAMDEFEHEAPPAIAQALAPAIRQLCDPDPGLRGHPLTRASLGSPYSLERYVSLFNVLARRAEVGAYRDIA